jgi:PAS domain S-box-containing protein
MWAFVGPPLQAKYTPHVFMPRAAPEQSWVLVLSNVCIAAALFAIVLVLIEVMRKRHDVRHRWIFYLVGSFFGWRGIMQTLSIWTIFHPQYQLEWQFRVVSAITGVATAAVLHKIPTTAELEREIEVRRLAEETALKLVDANMRDISTIRVAESRFRGLLESAPDAMVIMNAEGRIELINLQTEKLFGYTSAELLGEPVEVLVPQSLHGAHAAHRREYFVHPKKREMGAGLDLMAVRKDGSEFPVEISLSPLEGPGGISVTAAIRDVTSRKDATRALAEKVEELRHSNEQLEQFAHIASHDLQEPLRMVASYTQLRAKRYKGRLDSDADEFIGYAVDGTQRMKQLIEALLEYSRTGKGSPPVRHFAGELVVEQALANLRVRIEESGAVVTLDPLPVITASDEPLVQIFQNLVGNAIKYRGERSPRIHISSSITEAEWIFSVADNGIGIDPRYFEKIFLIFQRLHGQDEYEGTGIGLAICHRILHQQGGRIWVESEPGQGSTFYFALPVR